MEHGANFDRQQYPLVDLIKYICALLVVSIHIAPLSSYIDQFTIAKYLNYGIQNYIARIAVPFYFAVAGFFLFRKINLDAFDISITQNYIFKLLRLLGLWTVLLFVGRSDQLWYMGGLAIAVCLLSVLLYRKVPLKKMIIIASLLYIIALLGNSYYGLLRPLQDYKIIDYAIKFYNKVFGTTRNGLFMGFPFLVVGGVIEKKRVSMKPLFAFIGFILSMIALFCEAFCIKTFNLPKLPITVDMYIFLMPVIFFLLVFTISVPVKERTIYKKLRNVGIIVYFSHFFVYQWIVWGWKAIDRLLGIAINNSLVNYILTIVFATILGFIIDGLSRKKELSFLKYLYS